jgi:hypothetical protein
MRTRVALGFVALLAVASVPVFSTILPPLVDYPNHLARMHLLAEGGNRFYAVRWAPLPDLAADLIVPPLSRLMPLMLAGKVFLVMIFALLAGGTVWLNRIVAGYWRLWPLLAFLFLYNRLLLWGFVNDLFGLGVALCGLALWLALERRPAAVRVPTSCVAALFCFFSHIVAFGVYGLAIAGVELVPAWAELRRRDGRAVIRRLAAAGAQFVIPVAILAAWWRPPLSAGAVGFGGFGRKPDLLFNVFDNYSRPFDIVCFLLLVAMLGVLAASRRLSLAPRIGVAAALVFAAYLALPSEFLSGSGADHRLPLALFLLIVAGAVPRLARREAIAFGAAAALMFVARIGVIESVWLRADRVYTADLAILDHVPAGAKLAVGYPPNAIHAGAIPLIHFPTLAAARREAFVPTVFASPVQQPLALTPAYAELVEPGPETWWLAFVSDDPVARKRLGPLLPQYDFVVFVDSRTFALPADPCLHPAGEEPGLTLAEIVHGAGCTP